MNETYVLVGMMGCGKSTLGRLLGARLGLEFHDADAVFESVNGMAISEFFRLRGEEEFRIRERELLERLAAMPGGRVLSAGGGAFCQDGTREFLLGTTVVIFVRVGEDELIRRLERSDVTARPMLGGENWRARVRELAESRRSCYEQAHIIVDVGEEEPERTAERLARRIAQRKRDGQGGEAC